MTLDEARRELIFGKPDTYKFAMALVIAIDTMHKYQKIEQIVDRPTGNNAEEKAYNYMMIVKDIKEILKDGNVDN